LRGILHSSLDQPKDPDSDFRQIDKPGARLKSEDFGAFYFASISRIPPLAKCEDLILARRWRDHRDIAARDRLIRAHLRMVPPLARAAAKRFYEPSWKTLPAGCAKDACAGYEARISHLIAAGNLGLMLAADRFDPDRGVCFATAAKYSIRKEIWTEAGFDMSVVTRPCRERYLFDVSLTATDDRGQIDIAEKLPLKSRRPCPNADQGDDDGR
jgi:DNA-directed RNA polymerase sigma subunit (sigma70/sigma32)